MSRKHITLKTKLAAALCHMLRPDEHGHLVRVISHDEAKALTADEIIAKFDFHHHPIPKAHGGPDRHWNLPPMLRAEHKIETAKVTIPTVAKGKRITKAHEDFRRRMLAKDAGEPRQASKWPNRKLRSRGFEPRAT